MTPPEGVEIDYPSLAEELQANRTSIWVMAILSVTVGILALVLPQVTTYALAIILGAILCIFGIIKSILAFNMRRTRHLASGLAIGIVSLLAGVLLLLFPLAGVLSLTLLLIAYFLVAGAIKISFAFRLRPSRGWGLMLVGGIVSLILAALIWVTLPGSAAWVPGLLLGIDLVLYGLALIWAVTGARAVTHAT